MTDVIEENKLEEQIPQEQQFDDLFSECEDGDYYKRSHG